MKQKQSNGKFRSVLCVALLLTAGMLCPAGSRIAAGSAAPVTEHQIEIGVIHVDQYAVYAPNMVFYFDTKMDKRKIGSLTRAAEHLRNKKALITYSSTGDPSRDKHLVLVDIVSPSDRSRTEKPAPAAPQQPVDPPGRPAAAIAEPPKAVPDTQVKTAKVPAVEEKPPAAGPSPVQQAPSKKPVPQEVLQPQPAAPTGTITREEATAFVRRIMELNSRKDLAAVAPFYAEKVDYYDRGLVDRDYVKRDLGYYFRNWDLINTSLEGDVVIIVLEPEVRTLKFVSSFSVKNAKKSLSGRTENIWKIKKIGGQLRVIDVKQRILGKESPPGL